jgi:hypothetical protein
LREHLLRLAAIRKLQRDEGLELRAIRRRLDAMSQAELEQAACVFLPELMAGADGSAKENESQVAAPELAGAGTMWQRLTLLPGLELHVSSDASPHVRRTALELEMQFGALRASGSGAPETEPHAVGR